MSRAHSRRTAAALASLVVAAFVTLAGCGVQPHGDAGVETQGPDPREFNVGASGNDTCPGELYNTASYGRATCSGGSQRCVSVPASTSRVICTCSSPSNSWSCREERL